jgi:hypothetical protein
MTGYKHLTKYEAQQVAASRFEQMAIPLSTALKDPIIAFVAPDTKKWLGILKVDLALPARDGIALLCGDRAFVMPLQDGELVVAKVEKGFEFLSAATHRRVRLDSGAFQGLHSNQVMSELIKYAYYAGGELEVASVSKPTKNSHFATIIIAGEASKQFLLNKQHTLGDDTIIASIPEGTQDHKYTIIARGLPIHVPLSQIIIALSRLLGKANIVAIRSSTSTSGATMDRHDGMVHIICQTPTIYLQWKSGSHSILGRTVDFLPHRHSVDGTNASAATKALSNFPARQAVAEGINSLRNQVVPTNSLTSNQLTDSLKESESRLEARIAALTHEVNAHTTKESTGVTTVVTNHQNRVLDQLGQLSAAFQTFGRSMTGLSHSLDQSVQLARVPTPLLPPGLPAPPGPLSPQPIPPLHHLENPCTYE